MEDFVVTNLVLARTDLPYIFRWEREGRKGQACRVLARGTMNSCLVEFADGFTMVTSRNALKRNRSKQETKMSSGKDDKIAGIAKNACLPHGKSLSGQNTELLQRVLHPTGRALEDATLEDLGNLLDAAREEGRLERR